MEKQKGQNMTNKVDTVIDQLTGAVVDLMETSPEEWTKPWAGRTGLAHNPATGTTYSGGNQMLLMWVNETGDPRWSTYKGWQKLGAQVRAGESGQAILYAGKSYKNKETGKWVNKIPAGATSDQYDSRMMFRAYTVFNGVQVDGAPAWEQPVVSPDIDVDDYRTYFQSLGADWRETPSDMAFYSPHGDYISTPEDVQFNSPTAWFATVAHEFTHWTGHKSRTNRSNEKQKDGRAGYAFEELVAELGAVFLSAHFGVATNPRPDHAQYIKSWLKALDNDKDFIWSAASKAGTAVKWIIDNSNPALLELGREVA